MAEQEDKLGLSKKGKREVSPFVGHELLYDHLMGNLDPERGAAVTDHLKFSRDAQLDLSKIETGIKYTEKLSETVVSQPILQQIGVPSNYLTVLMQKSQFDRWPQGLKWGLEALVVVAAIVIVLTLTPWQRVVQFGMQSGSKEVILAEVSKTETTTPSEDDKPQFADEGIKPAATASPVVAASPAATQTPAATVAVAVKSPTPVQTPIAKASPLPSAPAAVVAAAPTPVATVAAKASPVIDTSPDAAATAITGAGGGFLYRGDIAVTNLVVTGPKITEKILELGGRKAGAVELGWKKTSTSMYYHFTIPEARYQDLMTFLGTYGKPQIAKEKHPRVMPDGIIRLILTVDENSQ